MSSFGRFNCRMQSNSYSYQEARAYHEEFVLQKGTSFYGMSLPQYEYNTRGGLGNIGAGKASGNREFRYLKSKGLI